MNTSQYLTEEIERLKKKTRVAVAAGVFFSGVVVLYIVMAMWINSVFSNTSDIANFALAKFAQAAPRAITTMEGNLTRQAPGVADHLSKQLQLAIPALRVKAQVTIDRVINDQFANMQKQTIEMSNAYFVAHAHQLPARKSKESIEAYSKRVANVLADSFGQELNRNMQQAMGQDIYNLNIKSKYLLELSKKHFDNLAQTPFDDLSHDDQLERLLIEGLLKNYLTSHSH